MKKPCSILFICTGNSCRSQMAEALLRHMAGERFVARSAGSHPAGFVHSLATTTLRRLNVPVDGLYSKSWHELAREEHTAVITVCDAAASEPCPAWPGQAATAHWSLPDPTLVEGTEEERLAAAADVAQQLVTWISALIALPIEELSPEELREELKRIAQERPPAGPE